MEGTITINPDPDIRIYINNYSLVDNGVYNSTNSIGRIYLPENYVSLLNFPDVSIHAHTTIKRMSSVSRICFLSVFYVPIYVPDPGLYRFGTTKKDVL